MITYKFDFDRPYLEIAPDTVVNVGIKLWTTIFTTIHTHEFWEIIFVLDGSCINILDGESRILNKYDICLVKRKNIHQLAEYENKSIKYLNIPIRESYFEHLATLINPNFFKDFEQYKTLSPQVFDNIYQLLNEAIATPISIAPQKKQALFQAATAKLITEFSFKQENQRSNLVNAVIALMSNPDNMKLNIKEISHKAMYSMEYITRAFKKNNSPSPNQVFTKIKLDYACELLSTTDYKTVLIAEMVGFNDINYFNKIFKKHFGLSPLQYRKKFETYSTAISIPPPQRFINRR